MEENLYYAILFNQIKQPQKYFDHNKVELQ